MRSTIKGSYFQLKDSKGKPINKWRIQLYTGRDPVTLKYKRHTEIIKGKEAEAKRRLKELSDTQDKGILIPQGKLTVAEHFNRFLDGYIKSKCYESTYDEYRAIIEKHLNPILGHIQLKQLQPQQIQDYYGKMRETLSGNTVNRHHRLLTQSFKYAVRQGYLGRNPCDIVDAPTIKRKTMRAMNPDEVETLMQKAEGNYYYPVIYTAVHTGLRRAELLGLRWRDINLDETTISINQVLKKHRGTSQFKEPKTNHSRRRLGMTPKLALFLREYKRSRENLYLDHGQVLGLDSLVFAH
jgi:integrase